jgi:hypothetical protein
MIVRYHLSVVVHTSRFSHVQLEHFVLVQIVLRGFEALELELFDFAERDVKNTGSLHLVLSPQVFLPCGRCHAFEAAQ